MSPQEVADKIIEAVQSGKLGKLDCEERLDTMEAKGRSGAVMTPFTTAAELLNACQIVRQFLATFQELVAQADRDIAQYNRMVTKR